MFIINLFYFKSLSPFPVHPLPGLETAVFDLLQEGERDMSRRKGGDSVYRDHQPPVVPDPPDMADESLENPVRDPHQVAFMVLRSIVAQVLQVAVLEVAECDERIHLRIRNHQGHPCQRIIVRSHLPGEPVP